MPYTIAREHLGHDATPDFSQAPKEIGQVFAAIPHKADVDFQRWTIVGWRFVGSNGWADVDSDGVCYATGKTYLPES